MKKFSKQVTIIMNKVNIVVILLIFQEISAQNPPIGNNGNIFKGLIPNLDTSILTSLATNTVENFKNALEGSTSAIESLQNNFLQNNNFQKTYEDIVQNADKLITGSFTNVLNSLGNPTNIFKEIMEAKNRFISMIRSAVDSLIGVLEGLTQTLFEIIRSAIGSTKQMAGIAESASSLVANAGGASPKVWSCVNKYLEKITQATIPSNFEIFKCAADQAPEIQHKLNATEMAVSAVINNESKDLSKNFENCNNTDNPENCTNKTVENLDKSAGEVTKSIDNIKELVTKGINDKLEKVKSCYQDVVNTVTSGVDGLKKEFTTCLSG